MAALTVFSVEIEMSEFTFYAEAQRAQRNAEKDFLFGFAVSLDFHFIGERFVFLFWLLFLTILSLRLFSAFSAPLRMLFAFT